MQYTPTIISNEWQTETANNNGNGGIHCQEGFRQAVQMIEAATASYSSPALVHTTLTQASLDQYKLFITQLKRLLKASDITFEYKGCWEADKHKGQHVHVMWIVDVADTASVFDMEDVSSLASVVLARLRKQAPELYIHVGKLRKHGGQEHMALTTNTLQDACCYMSYIFKARSKLDGHKYLSSRKTRRVVH